MKFLINFMVASASVTSPSMVERNFARARPSSVFGSRIIRSVVDCKRLLGVSSSTDGRRAAFTRGVVVEETDGRVMELEAEGVVAPSDKTGGREAEAAEEDEVVRSGFDCVSVFD